MTATRLIQVFDAEGREIASAPCPRTCKRFSQQAAADQRKIDGLYRPGAVRATLDGYTFRFDGRGRSQVEI